MFALQAGRQPRKNERFELSDMDHTMPKIYVQIAEVFQLDETADKDLIVANLIKGLEFTLQQFLILTGSLQVEESTGRMWITSNKNSGVGFYIKHLPEMSYTELNERDFPASMIKCQDVLPKSVTEKQLFSPLGDNAAEDTIISTFQVTFITGGLILGTAIHHSCSDGPGCDGFLTTWAESNTAASCQQPFRPINTAALDRSRLSAPTVPDAVTWHRLNETLQKSSILKDAGGPPAPPPQTSNCPRSHP